MARSGGGGGSVSGVCENGMRLTSATATLCSVYLFACLPAGSPSSGKPPADAATLCSAHMLTHLPTWLSLQLPMVNFPQGELALLSCPTR